MHSRMPTVEDCDDDDDDTSGIESMSSIEPVGVPTSAPQSPNVSRTTNQSHDTPSCIPRLKHQNTKREHASPQSHDTQPKEHAPAQKIAGVRRSSHVRLQANKNAEYEQKLEEERFNRLQRTLKREAKRLAELTKDQNANEDKIPDLTPDQEDNEQEDEWENDVHFAGLASENPTNDNLPENLEQAYSRPDSDQWRAAMIDELNNLKVNQVYEEVPIPEGVKPITSKAVFRLKFDGNGNITRHKIRIVARGFVQCEGVDYNEIFAPVANVESVRVIIALAAKYNLELDQIYLTPPEGTEIKPGHCWRLRWSLYGLKQAGRTWNKTLD
jgi:Reverse transcriptase (RNA-dependent DNA polymerase)